MEFMFDAGDFKKDGAQSEPESKPIEKEASFIYS